MALNIPKLSVNTGTPRNVTGHVISGALAAGVAAGALNYNKYKSGDLDKTEAINDSIKLGAQGGIATGSAIAAANYVGEGKYLSMLSAVSLGIAGVYAVEKVAEKLQFIKAKELEVSEEE